MTSPVPDPKASPRQRTLALVVRLFVFGLVAGCGASKVEMSNVGEPVGYAAFEHHGVFPVVDTEEMAGVSVSLGQDRASHDIAQHYLRSGRIPPAAAIRVEDFVAALGGPSGGGGRGVLSSTLGPSPYRPGWHLLVISIAPDATRLEKRADWTTTVWSIDLDGPVERALLAKGAVVRRGSMAVAGAAGDATGHTIIVMSGAGLGGIESQGAMLRDAGRRLEAGALVSVVARIEAGLDDAFLDALAASGGGLHEVWVPGREEAIVRRLMGQFALVDARLDVRFAGPRRWRLVGHESRSMIDSKRRLVGGAIPEGEVGRVVFELDLGGRAPGELGVMELRGRPPGAAARLNAEAAPLARMPLVPGPPDESHRRVTLVAMLAEKLRGTFWMKDVPIDVFVSELQGLPREGELDWLVASVVKLWPRREPMRERPTSHKAVLP